MRALVTIPVLLVVAALAGCLGSSEPPTTTPNATPPGPGPAPTPAPLPLNATNASGPEVQKFDGAVVGAGAPGGGYVSVQPLSKNGFQFDVKNGTTGFVLELVANGSSSLDLVADVPQELCTAGDPAGATGQCPNGPKAVEGAPPLRMVVTDPAMLYAGKWGVRVFAQQAPQPVAFTVYVSVFYGALPTDAYSAVPKS